MYSADLVSLGPTSIDGQEALENMRNDVQSAIDEEESKVDGDEATESGKETVLSKYISGPALWDVEVNANTGFAKTRSPALIR